MSEEVKFKPRKVKNLRARRNSSSEEEEAETQGDDDVLIKLEEAKTKQKLRVKPHGVNAVALAIGQKVTTEDLVLKNDPFKIKSGGMLNMNNLKTGKIQQVDDAYDVGIGTQFSAETNKRDEDEEMMKYIEEQLNKRKNSKLQNSNDNENESFDERYLSPEEAALLSLPEHLRISSTHRSEEMLSNQMLNGIPEVDLGIDVKIKNIEATEAAKEKLIRDQKNKKSTPSHFVPTNMAVNFVQHNRFNIEDAESKRRRQRQQEERERERNGEGHQRNGLKRATDDYHYDKFRKQFRRY